MKLEKKKNSYGHEVVDCPFCADFVYVRERPEPLRDLKRHIANQAKNEALEKCIGSKEIVAHLDYYLAHTESKVVRVPKKRQFDNDLQL